MNLTELANKHFDWVERMGWHNKTVLESLALIGSEIGEAAAECMQGLVTEKFGTELCDIVLRTVDLSKTEGVNLEEVVPKMGETPWHSKGVQDDMLDLMVEYATWVNTARVATLGPEFGVSMGRVLFKVTNIARENGIDLASVIQQKMELNEIRGTRGRRI